MSLILFVGGGTLGHIVPAIAIARALQERCPDTSAHFVCSPRGEAEFLKKESLPYTIIDSPRLSWDFPWKFFFAHRQSMALLRSLKPKVVFSKGGYVSVPVCFAAKKLGIPIILHESDAVMGRANQLIAKMATHVCLGFPIKNIIADCRLQKDISAICNLQYLFTGNPLRPEITQGSRDEGLRITGFSGTRPILLVMGGSQGAQVINEWVANHLPELTQKYDVIHLTGVGKSTTRNQQPGTCSPEPGTRNYLPLPFAYTEFPHLYACTTIAISRAGAGSIAELLGNGIPTILIPISGLAHDHQLKNALSLQERKVALLVTQNDMDKDLMNVVSQLMKNSEEYQLMKDRIRKMQGGDSTGQIVDIISKTLVGKHGA